MNLQKEYENACNTFSDINQHLPILFEAAQECDHITELGVRYGASTCAFLYANLKKYIAYDLYIDEVDEKVVEIIKDAVSGSDLDSGKFIQRKHKTY